MKTNPAKKTGIVIDQRVFAGDENEVVVQAWRIGAWSGEEFACHAKVNSKPPVFFDLKEHLFSVGVRGAQDLSPDLSQKHGNREPAEDSFFGMPMDPENP